MSESIRNEDRLLRTYDEHKEGPERLAVAAGAKPAGPELTQVLVRATANRQCTTTRHFVVDRTRVTDREWVSGGRNDRASLYFWGSVGLAGAAVGSYFLAAPPKGDGSESDRAQQESQRSTGLALILIGGPLALTPIVNEVRATDSRDHIGEVEDTSTISSATCKERAVEGATIILRAGADELARGTTDQSGIATLSAPSSRVLQLGGKYEVTLDGVLVGTTDALQDAYERAAATAKRAAAAAEQARVHAIAEDEVRTGRCHQPNVDRLRQFLGVLRRAFDATEHPWIITSHELTVATPAGTPLEFNPGTGGEYHLVALQFSDALELNITDGTGYPINTKSRFMNGVFERWAGEVVSASRVVPADFGESLGIVVKGLGCTLVISAERI